MAPSWAVVTTTGMLTLLDPDLALSDGVATSRRPQLTLTDRAWIWDFSSQHSRTAPSGGSRYRPTTSTTFASNSGSVENRNDPDRHGWIPCARHALAMVELPTFNRAPN